MRYFVPLVILLVLAPASAQSASIGLFSTPDCTSCNLDLSPGETKFVYVSALTEGLPDWVLWGGGAEFRVAGLPPGWVTVSIPNPQISLIIGDPFDQGVLLGFPQLPQGTCVLLYTVVLWAPLGQPQEDVALHVTARTPPSFPNYPCPWFTLYCGPACDIFDPYCVGGGTLFINSSQTCTVGVQQHTWSEVKSLYE
jgi:hypothetical protein